MQREQADGSIESRLGNIIDITLLKCDACVERPKHSLRERQHLRRRIDADKRPSRVSFRQRFELEPAARAENQDTRIFRNALCEK